MTRPQLGTDDGLKRRCAVLLRCGLVLALATGCDTWSDTGSTLEMPATGSSDVNEEHAVLIHVANPDNPGDFGLDLVEDPIIEALESAGVGEYDGNEIGPDGAVIYLYGPNADRLLGAVRPALRSAPLPAGSYAIKRYGPPGADEERVDLD